MTRLRMTAEDAADGHYGEEGHVSQRSHYHHQTHTTA